MVRALEADSFWVDGSGRAVAVGLDDRLAGGVDRGEAMDRLGWVHVHACPDRVEFWLNPISVRQPTLGTAVELAEMLHDTAGDRPLVVRVHDRESRGSLVAESADQLPDLIRESVGLTSRPGHPLMQDRLVGCLPTDINDAHVQDMWKFLVGTRFTPSEELVDRVISTEGRAKVVTVHARSGGVRYLAHDRRTAGIWKRPEGLAGRLLDDVPMPTPLKRSIRSDLTVMMRERQIVVSFVRGLRRVMPHDAPMDSFFRISIPLRRLPGAVERSALVLLSPYG